MENRETGEITPIPPDMAADLLAAAEGFETMMRVDESGDEMVVIRLPDNVYRAQAKKLAARRARNKAGAASRRKNRPAKK